MESLFDNYTKDLKVPSLTLFNSLVEIANRMIDTWVELPQDPAYQLELGLTFKEFKESRRILESNRFIEFDDSSDILHFRVLPLICIKAV
mgnify:CR=1 FL=1